MKNILSFFSIAAIVLASCGSGGNTKDANSNDTIPALPSSGAANERVFKSTGEVVIGFLPTAEELTAKKISTEQLNEYNEWYRNIVTPLCKEKGIETYQSSEDNIMLHISEKEKFTILRTAMKNPFGVIITKTGSQPIIFNELVSESKLDSVLTTIK